MSSSVLNPRSSDDSGDLQFFTRREFVTLESLEPMAYLVLEPTEHPNSTSIDLQEVPMVTASAAPGATLTEEGLSGMIRSAWQELPIPSFDSIFFQMSNSVEFPEKPKKKKAPKLKTKATEEEIAKAIAKHTDTKQKEIDRQSKLIEADIESEEKRELLAKKQRANRKIRLAFYKVQLERLKQPHKKQEENFTKTITQLKQHSKISNIEIDTSGRIFFTTIPLAVLKEKWKKEKTIGVYQICIDFAYGNISNGIRVLNITQRHPGDYDSPTILNTRCCWGNVKQDIVRDFQTQNLEELIEDMLEYITSPHTIHGYLGNGDEKDTGWEIWFKKLKKMPKNFSFLEWEKANREELLNTIEDSSIDFLESNILGNPVARDNQARAVGIAPRGVGAISESAFEYYTSVLNTSGSFPQLQTLENRQVIADQYLNVAESGYIPVSNNM